MQRQHSVAVPRGKGKKQLQDITVKEKYYPLNGSIAFNSNMNRSNPISRQATMLRSTSPLNAMAKSGVGLPQSSVESASPYF